MNSHKDRAYLKEQLGVYKWTSSLIYVTGSALVLGISLFNIFPKGILKLFSRPCWVAELYAINLPENIVDTIEPVKGWVSGILRSFERFVVFFWVLLCIILNLGVQLSYLCRFIKQKRNLSREYSLATMLREQRQ